MKDLIQLISSLTIQKIQLALELLTDGIHIPQPSEEFDTFSIQGQLTLQAPDTKLIKSIMIQFKGNVDRVKYHNGLNTKSSIIENQFALIDNFTQIPKGSSTIGFELAIPRNLPPTIDSEFFKVSYALVAAVECEGHTFSTQLPVTVFNPYLVPEDGILSNTFIHSGVAPRSLRYGVEFQKRFFDMNEKVPFTILIKPEANVAITHVSANVTQKVTMFGQSNAGSSAQNTDLLTLSQYTNHIKTSSDTHDIKFNLPISGNRPYRFILPSVDTPHFEIQHSIQIVIKHQLAGGEIQNYKVEVPIGISARGKEGVAGVLPAYFQTDQSVTVPIAEAPPVYSTLSCQ